MGSKLGQTRCMDLYEIHKLCYTIGVVIINIWESTRLVLTFTSQFVIIIK